MYGLPTDTAVAGPSGNPQCAAFTAFGCPVYSAGENCDMVETMLIEAQSSVLEWLQLVARGGEAYKNDVFEIFGEVQNGGDVQSEGDVQNEGGNLEALVKSAE